MKTGEHIIIVGLIIQLLFFGFFVIVAGVIHRRTIKFPTLGFEGLDSNGLGKDDHRSIAIAEAVGGTMCGKSTDLWS
jgi:hypothetical protein